ncbi:MAG: PAS domain S-box protein [Dehalococcoidales bacterium]|nr:PAS domain S-box protein [Dehalococcoidales bacterium]
MNTSNKKGDKPRRNPVSLFKNRRRSITLRTAVLILCLVLVSGIAGSFTLIQMSRDSIRQESLYTNLAQAKLASEFAFSYIETIEAHMRVFANRPDVRQAVINDTPEQLQQTLAEFVQIQSKLDSAGIYDITGIQRSFYNAESDTIGQSFADREWFQQVITIKQPYLGIPLISRATGNPILPYTVPIFNEQGQIKGVLTCGISLNKLSDSIVNIDYGKDTRVGIIDLRNEGIIIGNTDPQRVMTPVTRDNEAINLLMSGNSDVMETTSSSGELILTGFATMPDFPLGIVVITPSATALSVINTLTQNAVIFITAGIILSGILGVFLALGITKPLRKLIYGTKEIGSGNLDYPVATSVNDEVGDLSRAIGDMAQNLKQTLVSRDLLAAEVSERKKSEEKISGLNRILSAVRNVNQLITRENDRQNLISTACRNLTETRGFTKCWIAAIDPAGKVHATADAMWGDLFSQLQKRLYEGDFPRCIERVLKDKQTGVITADEYAALCSDCPLHTGQRNTCAVIIAPMNYAGRVMGILAASSPDDIILDNEEIELFQELADDIAFALHKIELEEKEKQTEKQFRLLVEHAPQAIFIQTDGNFAYINPAGIELFGAQDEKQIVGHPVIERVHPDFRETMLERIYQLNNEGQLVKSLEEKMLCIDGSIIDVEISATPFFYNNSHGALVFIRDVTERKKLESSLRESEARFRKMFEASGVIMFLVDPASGAIVDVNPAAVKFYGYAYEQFIKMNINQINTLTPDEIKEAMEKATTNRHNRFVFPHRLADGSIRTVEVHSHQADIAGHKYLYSIIYDITERKLAEKALEEEVARRAILFEQMPVGVVIVDPSTARILECNTIAHQQLGYSHEEFTNLTVMDIEANEKPAEVLSHIELILQEGEANFETLQRTKQGEIRNIHVTAKPVYLSGKTIYQCIWQDITERKRIEESLNKQQELLTRVAEYVPGVVYQYRLYPDGRSCFPYSSPGMMDIYAVTPEEVREDATPVFKRLHPDDYDYIVSTIQESARTLQDYHSEFRVILPELGVRWRICNAKPERLEDGSTLWYGTIQDSTERKLAEEALEKAAAEWRNTFDSITDMISIIDDKHRLIRVNKRFADAFGSTPQALSGRQCYEMVHGLKRPLAKCPHMKAVNSLKTETVEYYEDSLGIYVEETASPIMDAQGKCTGAIHIIKDITARKQAEMEQQALRDKMEVSSRLASVGEMAAGIAHEINNPLTGVIGFSQLLLNEDLPPDVKDSIKLINDGSIRVRDIVRRMLTFARQVKPQKAKVNIHELIDNTLEFRRYILNTANIEVIRKYDNNLPWITVDPGQLQQVFMNLVVNAENSMKKAHDRGTLIITTAKDANHIIISFKDDGLGMSKQLLSRIFHPFFTTKGPDEGTGLGLSLSRSIILEHGGSIEAQSEAGKGADFIIKLPVTSLPEEPKPQPEEENTKETASTRKASVLVIDDEATIRTFIRRILEKNGHTVTELDRPVKDNLENLFAAKFDIILLDMKMPGMSGKEFYTAIKKEYPDMARRTIFITGDTSDSTTVKFFKENNLLYIEKPFDQSTLINKINELLKKE